MKAQFIKTVFGMGISLVLTAAPAFAHHPFDPEFDWKRPVTLSGIVSKVGWAGPHVEVSIDVRDASGTVTTWVLELGSPKVLETNYRWNSNLLKTGDKVAVDGWLAKDSSKLVSAKTITLSDGQELFAASAFFDLPGRCISDVVCVEGATVGQKPPSGTGIPR
jgi:Family of unknown function (DUF6152)